MHPTDKRFPPRRSTGSRTGRSRRDGSGFALVITLSLMILLALLAVGLLSLSSLSLRGLDQGKHAAVARANAKLALLIALGELQKELGPDQRISAHAGILDQEPDSPAIEGVAQPHYLGVWDSWNTWLTDPRGGLSIQETYKPGRDPALFRRWLVSDPAGGRTLDFAREAVAEAAADSRVAVVGSGTLGPLAPDGAVSVPKLMLMRDAAVTGALAWWVADESQKARLDLHDRTIVAKPEAAQVVGGHGGRPGVEAMDGMRGFEATPKTLERMITPGQASISARHSKRRFHDLTAYSAGLLTDVRAGGFKGDLHHAFEQDTEGRRPLEMRQQVSLFGTPFDPPIRPMSGVLRSVRPQNPYIGPVSWRQMAEWYRLYRPTRGSIFRPLEWKGGSPLTGRFLMGRKTAPHILDEPDTRGYARQLVLLRQAWIIATRFEKGSTADANKYFLCAVPFIVYWNPYNVPMKVSSNEISSVATLSLAASIQYQVYQDGQAATPAATGLVSTIHGYTGYRATPRESRNGDIEFKPGEVRAFSVVDAIEPGRGANGMNGRFFADPGYLPLLNTVATRGLQEQIAVPTGATAPTLSLRLIVANRANDNYWWGNSGKAVTVGTYQNNGAPGLYDESGAAISGNHENTCVMGGYSVDWLTASETGGAWLIGDTPASRARWSQAASHPVPVAIIGLMAKSAEPMPFENGAATYAADFGNRTWLHAPPTALSCYLMNPGDLTRSNSPYQLHFRPVNGDQEVSQFLQTDGRNGFFGGGFGPATGQSQVVALELPSAPVANLAGFAGMRIEHGRARTIQTNATGSPYPMFNLKHLSHVGAAFGPGIGNSYAHPMIAPEGVYGRVNLGHDAGHPSGGFMSTNMNPFDDHWDHLFLANEGLWDAWFCSGMVPEMASGTVAKTRKAVATAFYEGEHGLVAERFTPYPGGRTASQLAAMADAETGWRTIAASLLNQGQFNVNSTSKEAWKAMLMSLRDRPVAWQDAASGARGIRRDADRVVLSRFTLANAVGEGQGPYDRLSWLGVRTLSESQIDQLAAQIVRQVKLRGPFLNQAEFVNRRLTSDRTGVVGTLQAAIDADEFDADYTGAVAGGGGINAAYKTGSAMISSTRARYPNQKAALGSRYAGIPGYVMQADLLQGLASSICVRGDTFLIRGYGESRVNGKAVSQAWCEAVVQRLPEYIDPGDAPDKWLRAADGSPATVHNPRAEPDLSPLNRKFGRRFDIISFRWLSRSTI